jgi:mycothiol synthase
MQAIQFRTTIGSEDAAALIAVHDACRETDRVMDGLSFEYLPGVTGYRDKLANTDPNDWIVVQSGSEVVGYGQTLSSWGEHNGKQVYLHLGWIKPSARGEGIGRELLSRLEARCLEKREQDGAAGEAEFAANASSTEEAAQRLLRAAGYLPIYTAMEMRFAPSQTLAVSLLPPGLTLRPVLPEHHRALWQCIGDAYYVHGADNQGRQIATEDGFKGYFPPDADPSLWFAAWEPSRIAGVVLCRVKNDVADIYEVSVVHWHRRKGVAKALLTAALAELRSRNLSAIRIVTWRENPSEAWRLYEAVGFQTVKEFPRWRKPIT